MAFNYKEQSYPATIQRFEIFKNYKNNRKISVRLRKHTQVTKCYFCTWGGPTRALGLRASQPCPAPGRAPHQLFRWPHNATPGSLLHTSAPLSVCALMEFFLKKKLWLQFLSAKQTCLGIHTTFQSQQYVLKGIAISPAQ